MKLVATYEERYIMGVSNTDARQFAVEAARIAQDLKSEDVVALDLRGLSGVCDYVVIATGTSDRQMRGVADALSEYGKKIGQRPYGIAGYDSSTWIILDYVDVVVHLFDRDRRNFYDLELLWGDAPQVNWARSESA